VKLFTVFDLFTLLPILLSISALIFSIITFLRTRSLEKYNFAEQQLNELLKISLEYPLFSDPDFTKNFSRQKVVLDPDYRKYDVYAMMIWNYLETLRDYYGNQKLISDKYPYSGVVDYWVVLHSRWYHEPDNRENYDDVFEKIFEKETKVPKIKK
jgi:hypothetical protein